MLNGWQTIWYFGWRGVASGASLGAITGTFIYPIFATVAGFVYGGVVGLVMGILLGIGVHFYNRRAYRQQMDFEEYQTNLVTGAGLATALVTAIPLFAVFAPVAALAAAYATHRYADDHAHHIIKRKNDGLLPNTQPHMEKAGVVGKFSDFFTARSKWLFLGGLLAVVLGSPIAGAIISTTSSYSTSPFSITWILIGILGWLAYYIPLVGLVGLANGMFIQMLNRVAFSPEWTHEQYKRRVMMVAGLFTLVITPIVGLLVGAPILAIIASVAARDYADWYFEGHEVDKAKRDAARLADDYKSDEESLEEFEADDEKVYQDFR